MPRYRKLRLATVAGIAIAASVAIAQPADIPACESALQPLNTKFPAVIIERCVFSGKALATFIVGVDGTTSDLAVDIMSQGLDERDAKCLTKYTQYWINDLRFPTRTSACKHSIPVTIKTDE